MNDDRFTLVRIPGSDAIYRLPAGCPVTDENLRRFGERVTPPSGDVVSDDEVEHTLRHGQSIRDRIRQALYDAALRAYIDRHGEPKPGAYDPVLAFIERAADAQAEMFSEVAWESLQEGRQLVAKFEVET